ncbi:MAG: acyl-CoA dehydrogenase family protein [Rhodopila sp.]
MTQVQTLLQAAIELTPDVLAVREDFDRDRALPGPLVEKLRAAGLFHLWLPTALGGPELRPAEFLPVIEALARADGSVGWCATNASVLSLLSGSMDEAAARDIFGQRAVAAGAAIPMGKAVAVAGGYRVTSPDAGRTAAASCTAAGSARTASSTTATIRARDRAVRRCVSCSSRKASWRSSTPGTSAACAAPAATTTA